MRESNDLSEEELANERALDLQRVQNEIIQSLVYIILDYNTLTKDYKDDTYFGANNNTYKEIEILYKNKPTTLSAFYDTNNHNMLFGLGSEYNSKQQLLTSQFSSNSSSINTQQDFILGLSKAKNFKTFFQEHSIEILFGSNYIRLPNDTINSVRSQFPLEDFGTTSKEISFRGDKGRAVFCLGF